MTNVPAREPGADIGKKIVGRKRSIIIDTAGLMLTVLVTAASLQDSVVGERLLNRLAAEHPASAKAGPTVATASTWWTMLPALASTSKSSTPPGTRSFTFLPRRWAVEPTLGWLMHHRRLARG